jgi:hypothetical protein
MSMPPELGVWAPRKWGAGMLQDGQDGRDGQAKMGWMGKMGWMDKG